MTEDRLTRMYEQQREFMALLQQRRNFPQFPVDITSKEGQKILKEISHDCADELHESRQHLKNSKSHRKTEIREIDREAYVEELCDCLHYFLEVVILSGISADELFEVYMKKGQVNFERIESSY